MRVPLAWLRSYCDPGTSAAEIADALTMSGDKLERLDSVGVGDPVRLRGRHACWRPGRTPTPTG